MMKINMKRNIKVTLKHSIHKYVERKKGELVGQQRETMKTSMYTFIAVISILLVVVNVVALLLRKTTLCYSYIVQY